MTLLHITLYFSNEKRHFVSIFLQRQWMGISPILIYSANSYFIQHLTLNCICYLSRSKAQKVVYSGRSDSKYWAVHVVIRVATRIVTYTIVVLHEWKPAFQTFLIKIALASYHSCWRCSDQGRGIKAPQKLLLSKWPRKGWNMKALSKSQVNE